LIVWTAYALVGLGLAGAFIATRNWLFVLAAGVLYAAFPLVRRVERRFRRHDVTLEGSVATCSCGWSSRHAIAAEAERAADRHRRRA
jgi:predicted PurR-regulated permease PerM